MNTLVWVLAIICTPIAVVAICVAVYAESCISEFEEMSKRK